MRSLSLSGPVSIWPILLPLSEVGVANCAVVLPLMTASVTSFWIVVMRLPTCRPIDANDVVYLFRGHDLDHTLSRL